MARNWIINGESMIYVKGMTGTAIEEKKELGLALEDAKITPIFNHKVIPVDDFGPDISPEVMWQLAGCRISASLVHWDLDVWNVVVAHSMVGSTEGTFVGAGTLMRNGKNLYADGNRFVTLYIDSPALNQPWRFPCTYLDATPFDLPLGVQRSVMSVSWKAIPLLPQGPTGAEGNFFEAKSENCILWDHSTT